MLYETIIVDEVDMVARKYEKYETRNMPELQAVVLPSHFVGAKNGDFLFTFQENH